MYHTDAFMDYTDNYLSFSLFYNVGLCTYYDWPSTGHVRTLHLVIEKSKFQ